MVQLHQLEGCSGGGSVVKSGEQSTSQVTGQSPPSQPANHTSETIVQEPGQDRPASTFPNGHCHLASTPTQSPANSASSGSLSRTPWVRNPYHQSFQRQPPRGYGQRGRGFGGPRSNNRLATLAHDRLQQNGFWRDHSSDNDIQPGQQHVMTNQRVMTNQHQNLVLNRRSISQAQLMSMMTADWSNFRSVLVTLSRLPDDTTTWDLYAGFESWGSIVYIDIEENAKGQRTGFAKIRFEPPPKQPVHPGAPWRISVQQRKVWLVIDEIRPQENEAGIRSPLQHFVPARIVLKPSSLTFGIMAQPNTFMSMRSVRPLSLQDDLTVTVNFRRRKLEVNFPVLFQDEARPDLAERVVMYRMEAKFESIAKVYRVSSTQTTAVVISFEYPPRFFHKKHDVERTHDVGRLSWGDNDLWARAVDISHDLNVSRIMPACLETNRYYIDIGRWTTYQLELDPAAQGQWKTVEEALVDWNIKTVLENGMEFVPKTEPRLWSMIESSNPAAKQPSCGLLASVEHIALPFDVRYQLEVCISHGVVEERNVTRDFLLKLQELSAKKVQDQNRARLVLEYAADQNRRIFDPMSLFSDEGAMTFYPPCTHVPPHCALVRKVTITPTRIYFHTPTLETTNRVVRHYGHLQENFLRVSFTDELNDGRINGCDTVRDNELYTRAFRVMNNGIQMGRWHWRFLAFGNSQIRENGAFFFSEGDGVTCDSIREWMGRFTHIKRVAKYAARLGQCFSTTRLLGDIPSPTIVSIPDVVHDKYTFTDGVGKISLRLAKMIADEWKQDSVPSGFQFRMGGCKGVLVTWPEVKDLEVHIRKSQKKFSSEFNGLEIIRVSNYTTATLNRQTITILSCLGVPDSVFMTLLRQQLRDYDHAMKDRAFACKLLRQHVDESQSSVMIANMLDYGFMEASEPYVKSMLQLWRSWSLKYLKEKARIPIAESAFVLGGVDETGTLKGYINKRRGRNQKIVKELPEIFLQISDPNNRGEPKIITGVCIVGRNPSLHPGDIRVVKAVDVPALHHLRDVVIFPMNGDRDVPSMCSGGDLDGDDFFVIWNKDLIPNEWTYPPMELEDSSAPELDHVPTVQELMIFFTMYMKNNSLPIIAHAHLAQADFWDSGAKDLRCIELAKLHSKAVDYVKSGVPAELEKKLKPRHYPHFMEKKNSYHSDRILGQMFDSVNQVHFTPDYETPFDARILKRFTIDPEMLKKARKIKSQYDTALKRVMGQMEVRTEFEVMSGFIMSKPRVGTVYKMHETVRRETDALRQQFKDDCIEAAGGSRDFKVLAPFVAAMYQVTHEEVQIALHECRTPHIRKDGRQGLRQIKPESMPLISFPWLFDSILGRIATTAGDGSPEKRKTSVTKESTSPTTKETYVLKPEDLRNMEYERTSAGVFHRGQVLRLFHHDDDDGDGVEEEEPSNHNNDDGDFVEEEQQQQQQIGRSPEQRIQRSPQPAVNRVEERPVPVTVRERQSPQLAANKFEQESVPVPVREIKPCQRLHGSSPVFRRNGTPPNRLNNRYKAATMSSGLSGATTLNETSQSSCSSAADVDRDLISFTPPEGDVPSGPSLMDLDPSYVNSSIREKLKSSGFVPVSDIFSGRKTSGGPHTFSSQQPVAGSPVDDPKPATVEVPIITITVASVDGQGEEEQEAEQKKTKVLGEKKEEGKGKDEKKEIRAGKEEKVKLETKAVKEEEEDEKQDLEVEEVILEAATTNAFEDLAKFA